MKNNEEKNNSQREKKIFYKELEETYSPFRKKQIKKQLNRNDKPFTLENPLIKQNYASCKKSNQGNKI